MQIYLSEVVDVYADLSSQKKWDEKDHFPTRKKLLSTLESISGYNPEALLKRLPADALYEERAIILGKMNQHELALSLYVHKVLFLIYSFWFQIGKTTCRGSLLIATSVYDLKSTILFAWLAELLMA